MPEAALPWFKRGRGLEPESLAAVSITSVPDQHLEITGRWLQMKLDKKSLIQIVILIVLVIGGVGAYLAQQDGGLDFISGLFESEPAIIRAPTTAAVVKPAPGSA